MESKGKAFRQLLRDEPYLFTGGIYSPLDAQIAESAGMKSIYLSGYSVAMMNGFPDMGLLTMTEVAKTASMVASAVDHADRPGIREDRRGGYPCRGPALPQAVRSHRREDRGVPRRGHRQVQGGAGRA